MFTLDGIGGDTRLTARFPDVHADAQTEIFFQRTLRVPVDNNVYPLPGGLGPFPLQHLQDFEHEFAPAVRDRGGVIMPMHRGEAMWIGFDEHYPPVGRHPDARYPCAIKIGAGRINALNGKAWAEDLDGSECDYLVAPPQAALDGFRTQADIVRQFVAVPLGDGSSVEEQITSDARHGGIQIVVYPMKKERYEDLQASRTPAGGADLGGDLFALASSDGTEPEREPVPHYLSLAAGGCMSQRIYVDPHGIDAWDQSARARCIVTLLDVGRWMRITGTPAPTTPFTPADYERHRVPWFEYYNDDLQELGGASKLAEIKPVKGLRVIPVGAIDPSEVVRLRPVRPPRRSRHPRPSVRAFWGLFRRG